MKKILTAILSISMLLGSVSAVSFAEDETSVNAALGCMVYTDSKTATGVNSWKKADDNIASNIVDGDLSTRYTTKNGENTMIVIDLGAARKVSNVVIKNGSDSVDLKNNIAFVSTNMPKPITGDYGTATDVINAIKEWGKLETNFGYYSITTNNTANGVTTIEFNKQARYITIAHAYSGYLDIAEVEVYLANGQTKPNSSSCNIVPNAAKYVTSTYRETNISASELPHSVSRISDENFNLGWFSNVTDGVTEKLIVDLGQKVPIDLLTFVPSDVNAASRTNFKVYLTNDLNKDTDKRELYNDSGEATKQKLYMYTMQSDTTDDSGNTTRTYPSYRYVVVEKNAPGANLGLSELSVFAYKNTYNANSGVFSMSAGKTTSHSSAYAGVDSSRIVSHTNASWKTADGAKVQTGFVYVDLTEPRFIESVSLISSGGAALRTGMELVLTNDTSDFKAGKGTVVTSSELFGSEIIAENAGDCSGLVVAKLPSSISNYQTGTKFRYVGLRKSPNETLGTDGQISLRAFDVYGKTSYYSESFGPISASYSGGALTANTTITTAADKEYPMVAAFYDDTGKLLGCQTDKIQKVSDAAAADNGSDTVGYYTLNKIKKSFTNTYDNAVKAKVMIFGSFDKLNPMQPFAEAVITAEESN